MGHRDLENLHMIYEETKRLAKKHNWPYNFKVDDGDFETRIDIDSDGDWKRGNGQLPLTGYEMFCPDLIDFNTCTIIEYEEEAKANTGFFGAKKHKGHFPELTNKKDTVRDWYYLQTKFAFFKIWEHHIKDGSWKALLFIFLRDYTPDKRGV